MINGIVRNSAYNLSFLFFCISGATLGKGVNRMLATLTGGFLAVGAHRMATLSGRRGEPIFIAIFVFIIGIININK